MLLRREKRPRLAAMAEATMTDTCVILTRSATENAYNLPEESFSEGVAMICGYRPSSRREVQEGGQVIIADAELRLPSGTALGYLDRVRITHKLGQALEPEPVYRVIGQPDQGQSAVVATLKRIG